MSTKKTVAKNPKVAEAKAKQAEAIETDLAALEAGFESEKERLEAKLAQEEDAMARMLATQEAERNAAADPDSGVDQGVDWDFLQDDPSDMQPYLSRAKQPHEPDKYHYRWVGTNQRNYNKRRTQGYEPVPGSITKGDQVACRMPKALYERRLKMVEHRRRLMTEGTSGTFESEVRQQGGIPFDGSRSRSDGMR